MYRLRFQRIQGNRGYYKDTLALAAVTFMYATVDPWVGCAIPMLVNASGAHFCRDSE